MIATRKVRPQVGGPADGATDRYAFRSPSIFTTITVRVLVWGTPPATYVPAGLRESLLGLLEGLAVGTEW